MLPSALPHSHPTVKTRQQHMPMLNLPAASSSSPVGSRSRSRSTREDKSGHLSSGTKPALLLQITVHRDLLQAPYSLPQGCSGPHAPVHHRIRGGTRRQVPASSHRMVGPKNLSSFRPRTLRMVTTQRLRCSHLRRRSVTAASPSCEDSRTCPYFSSRPCL